MSDASEASRYEALVKIAAGGMATVYVGVLRNALGIHQLVAIKRPHEHLVGDAGFRRTLLAEARVASRVRHANVVDVRDVEESGPSVQLVMDYVEGAALSQLLGAWQRKEAELPSAVALRIVLDACEGLHAAHEARSDDDSPLGLVHRDVSPQNILVGLDGVVRLTDFGIAKSLQHVDDPTTQGTLKGKLGYLSPEAIRGRGVDRRADVFALGVVLWESLAGRRLFRGETDGETIDRVLRGAIAPLAEVDASLAAVDPIVARALARDANERFATARELADALRGAVEPAQVASREEVARAVRLAVGPLLDKRRAEVRARLDALAPASIAPRTRVVAPASSEREPAPAPRSPKRGRTVAIAVACVALASVAAVAAFALRSSRADEASARPSEPRIAADSPRARADVPPERASTDDEPKTSRAQAPRASRPAASARSAPADTAPASAFAASAYKEPKPNPYVR